MNPTIILLLLCLSGTIYIFYKFFRSSFFHNIVLTYIAILLTLYCFTPQGFDWFYLFQMDYLFDTLNMPIFQKSKIEVPVQVTQNVLEELTILYKNQSLYFASLNTKLDLTNELLLKIAEQNKTLLQQGLTVSNENINSFKYLAKHLVEVKEGLKAVHSSIEVTSKANLAVLKETQNSLVYLSNISVKSLDSLQVLNNQFLISSSELSKINSVLNAQNELTSNGFTALHKSLETSSVATTELQNQLDLIKQKRVDENYRAYTEHQKLLKDYESYKAKTEAEIAALKPKQSVTETTVVSSWFTWFSDKPQN